LFKRENKKEIKSSQSQGLVLSEVKPIIRPNEFPCRWARVGPGHLSRLPFPFPVSPSRLLPPSQRCRRRRRSIHLQVTSHVLRLHRFPVILLLRHASSRPSMRFSCASLLVSGLRDTRSVFRRSGSRAPASQATIPRLQRAVQSPIAFALPLGGRDAVGEVLGPLVAGEPRAPLLAPLPDRALPCLIASSWRADRCAAAVVSSTGARGTRVWPSRAPRQRLRQASEVYSPVRSGQPLCR